MQITNLKKSPQFQAKALTLIESAFKYDPKNSFATDFYPLFNPQNFENCLVIVKEEKVLAHLGYLKRNLTLQDYPLTMYGGIAVDPTARGKGLFKKLMQEALSLNTEACMHLLWSDQVDLYEKFSFYPCGELNSYQQAQTYESDFTVEKTKLWKLSDSQLRVIQKLYQNNELRIKRDQSHWLDLKEVKSADLYLLRQGHEIKNYFFKNKGQDLTNIIHEYGSINKESLYTMLAYGDLWSPIQLDGIERSSIYLTNLKIGDFKKFKAFIYDYTKMIIDSIENNKVSFHYQKEKHVLNINDFLMGVFGPGQFKELDCHALFIPGLDSI